MLPEPARLAVSYPASVRVPSDLKGAQAERGDLSKGGVDNRGTLQSRLAAFLKACPASVIVLENAQVRPRTTTL